MWRGAEGSKRLSRIWVRVWEGRVGRVVIGGRGGGVDMVTVLRERVCKDEVWRTKTVYGEC